MSVKSRLTQAGNGTAIPSGMVGHTVSAFKPLASAVSLTTLQFVDIQTIQFDSDGIWELSTQTIIQRNGATVSTSDYSGGFYYTAGNTSNGQIIGLTTMSLNESISATFVYDSVTLNPIVVRLSGNTLTLPNGTTWTLVNKTLYHKTYSGAFTGGPVKAFGYIQAKLIG